MVESPLLSEASRSQVQRLSVEKMDSALVMAGEEGSVYNHADERAKFICWNDKQLPCQIAVALSRRKYVTYPVRAVASFRCGVRLRRKPSDSEHSMAVGA
jgi:hypothetical protein